MAKDFKSPRGLKKKIFGSMLFFLGALDTMLAVKAGISVETFYLFLMIAGVLLFTYGLIEGLKKEASGDRREGLEAESGKEVSAPTHKK